MIERKTTYVKAMNQAQQIKEFYLHLDGEDRLPTVLGTGRNAVVFLATTTPDPTSTANSYHAIKFLRDDNDPQYARAAAFRFFQEAEKVNTFDLVQRAFVRYFGWGAIGLPQPADEKGEFKDFWWNVQFADYKDTNKLYLVNDKEDTELSHLSKYYNLQGPFYVLELCQGTLHDLLEKNIVWSRLPAYSVPTFERSLLSQQKITHKDIKYVMREYLTQSPAGKSGYDILNSFKPDSSNANMIRSRAVLQIFQQIALIVSQLHNKHKDSHQRTPEVKESEPLAHRDLKPGNIFFQHDANVNGINNISIHLSDLGYVTNTKEIESGDFTMRSGQKGIDYQAPGSQFFRAPEQSELPIEVRVDIVSDKVVRITGSKVEQIEPQDWIVISDIFNKKNITTYDSSIPRDPKTFKIKEVKRLGESSDAYSGACYELVLDEALVTSRKEDLQGQIIRATGFQTDGFSLGAILYDLISGGRNPEMFYTYCIVSLLSQLKPGDGIKQIIDILCPEQSEGLRLVEHGDRKTSDLGLGEHRKIMNAIVESHSIDELLQRILEAAFSTTIFKQRAQLSFIDKLKIGDLIRKTPDIDNLIHALLLSHFFQQDPTQNVPEDIDSSVQAGITEQLKHYRFRNFDLVRSLLEDRRGVKIPRDILQIVVSCMVRDVEGSYYKRDPDKGYSSDENFDAASRIRSDVERLLGEPQYGLPEGTVFPKSLQENLLFKLRSLAQQPMVTATNIQTEDNG